MPIELWDFQREIVRDVRKAIRSHQSVGIVMPTGSGKTAVSGHISLRAYEELGGESVGRGVALYLVHRKELLKQTANTLDEIGLEGQHAFISPNHPGQPWKPLQIASIPYVARNGKELERIKRYINPHILIVDEAHHCVAATWKRIISEFPKAWKFMLTATPTRMKDDEPLGEIIDHLVLGPQIRELTPKFLAPIRAFSIAPTFNQVKQSIKAQSAGITKAVIANSIKNWQSLAYDRNTIFFAVDVKHSMEMVESLREKGVNAAHLDYKTPQHDRERMLRDLREGKLQCVSNVDIFTEGTDWPECDCVVLAKNTESFTLYRQMNGRCMRRKADGREAMVLDLAGNVHLHGLPDDDVHYDLQQGFSKEKKKKAAARNRSCEACNFVYPKKEPSCPRCGKEPEVGKVVEVDYELSEAQAKPKRQPPKAERKEIYRRVFATGGDREKLEALRREFEYKFGWVEKMQHMIRVSKGRKRR